MYETRAYDNEHGDPVVVLVATGTHDVSRLANLLNGSTPNSEQRRLADHVTRQVRRHGGGRAALRLLAEHGGPDLLTPVGETRPMFDVTAEVPDVSYGEPVTADRIIKALTVRALAAFKTAHALYPPIGGPDQERAPAMRRWSDRYSMAVYLYGVVYLLDALAKYAPHKADQVTQCLWSDFTSGDAGELLDDWIAQWGIDPAKHLEEAAKEAARIAGDVVTSEEIVLRGELAAQDAKFGEQNHPNLDPRDIDIVTHHYYAWRAQSWKDINSERAEPSRSVGRCVGHPEGPHSHTAWDGILFEEVYEALAESDPAALSAELLQVAAVAMQWRRSIARRPAPSTPDVPQETTTDA
ncbi:hypothetical protein [Nonomuraea glycinis]|uniref:hypothetical protein n=1 Tax=Nonomuraea glycinis TaxID=2047744 RepID=UPI0033BC435C